MNPSSADPVNDPVDDLLRQWSRDSTASHQHLHTLTRSIVEQVRAEVDESGQQEEAPRAAADVATSNVDHSNVDHSNVPFRSSLQSVGVRLLALAASLILLVTYLTRTEYWSAPETNPSVVSEQAIPPYAILNPTRLNEKAMLLAEMERVFDGDLQWIVETNHQVQLGTAGTPARDADSPSLVIRLVVERRDALAAVWQPAYAVDVVSRSEQSIQVKQIDRDLNLSLWAYAMPDGMVALDTDLLAGNLQARTNEILFDGQPKKIEVVQSNGTEYRVFQAVFTLDTPRS